MSIKLLITKVTNYIFLTYELIIGNRRLILPTMIGLIIALTVISQSGVLVESYRQEIFEEVVVKSLEEDYYNDDISIYIESGMGSDKLHDYESYNTLINQSIYQANYSDYILDYYWSTRLEGFIWVNQTEEDYNNGMSQESVSFCTSSASEFYLSLGHILNDTGKGRFPLNSSEVIFIRTIRDRGYWPQERYDALENVTLGTELNITLTSKWDDGGPNKTVKVVGIIEHTPFNPYNQDPDNSTKLVRKYLKRNWWWNHGLLTQPQFFEEIFEDLLDPINDMYYYVETQGTIILDKSNFDAFNMNSEISKLQSFRRALEWQFYGVAYDVWVESYLLGLMQEYEMTVFSFLIILLLLSFPVLCIALYLVVYSFGLIKRQKQEQIGIIKTRGGSWFQIFVVLLGEMLLSTILAVILGFLLSTLLADVVMRSSNYLEFLGLPVPLRVTVNMIQGLIFWGLIFALLLNFRNIIRMSHQEITETLEPTEIRNPLWKRYYLDVVMFTIGTATWIILMTLIRGGGDVLGPGAFLLYMIVSILGIPAPFFMFFGTIMVISRFFPLLMKKLAELLWRIEGGINAFAIRNIIRHKQAANRAVLLITLALSFSILSSSLIHSLDETEHLKRYYEVGADLAVPAGTSLNNTILKTLRHNISHLTSISGVYSTRYRSYRSFYRSYEFLFVDPNTYAKTAFIDPSFKLSSSLSNLMDEIKDNITIILYQRNLEAHISKPKIGGNISLVFENETMSKHLSFRVGGTFKYWPTMYPYQWYNPADNFWIIGSLGLFDRLNQSGYLDPPMAAYQAKIDSLNNIDMTVEIIQNVTGITPISPALEYREYKAGFGWRFSLSILNSDLLVCIVVAVIGVIMFAFFTYVERGKEIGVERALGMTQFQTAQSFLVEAATILAFGSIIGYFTGVYFVTMFLQVMQIGESIPPLVVTHPPILLVQIISGICITAGIGTIVPAYLATRKDISRILKVE
ncbi:MAG: FtsX-like permease family protein [Candidatus Heimdallarchaeota archaeon]|nr:MAG: FtsX-like permease family protein [Candidatus Heimdallarchaeota archaeon]